MGAWVYMGIYMGSTELISIMMILSSFLKRYINADQYF